MSKPDNTIRLIVVTTADDVDDEFNVRQPLKVAFNKALHEVGGESNRDQYALEFNDIVLDDLARRIGDAAAEYGWTDGTTLELVPRPVVV